MATAQEQLDEVQTAISACLTAQMITVRGRSLQRATLRDLDARETRLLKRIANNSRPISSVGIIDKPT